MKKLIILGAGTAGSIMANKMNKALPENEWNITVIEKEVNHYYQPGFLFIPFGYYLKKEIVKPVNQFIPNRVEIINKQIESIDGDKLIVKLTDGTIVAYDILIIATGTRISPEDTPGLKEDLWQKNIFDFYTIEGAEALAGFFKTWKEENL